MPFVTTDDGVDIHYEEAGSGPPLVLVHGWSMSGKVWRFQLEELADSFRVIAVDLRGHGRSSAAADCTFASFARDLGALFTTLGLEQATLVGWSMGAQVALEAFSLLRPHLAALVLVGGTPRFTAGDGYPHGLPVQEARGMGVRLKRDYQRTMGEFFRGMFAPGELSREQENLLAREIVIPGRLPTPEVARAALDELTSADQRDLLPSIDLPVLLVHGEADTICLTGAARFMANRLPHATLRVLAGMGHAPFLSHPREFNRILREFMEDKGLKAEG